MNLLFCLSLLWTLCLPVAFDASNQEDVEELKRQIRLLKAENRQLKKKLETAEFNGFYFSEKAVSSFLPVFKSMPESLQPKRGQKWDRQDLEEIESLLKAELVGKPFEAKFLIKSIEIIPSKRDEPATLTLELQPMKFAHNGFTFSQSLNTPGSPYSHYKFKIPLPEKTVASAKRLRPGKFVRVSGQIDDLKWRLSSSSEIVFWLRHLQINDFIER